MVFHYQREKNGVNVLARDQDVRYRPIEQEIMQPQN